MKRNNICAASLTTIPETVRSRILQLSVLQKARKKLSLLGFFPLFFNLYLRIVYRTKCCFKEQIIDQRQSFTQTWQRTPPDFFTPVACRLVRLSVRGASGYQSLVCRAASRMSIVNTDNQTLHGRGVWRHSGGLYLQQHLSTRPVIIWVNRAPRVFSRL